MQRNDFGDTALLLAARGGRSFVLDQLLQLSPQPDINVVDRRGFSALVNIVVVCLLFCCFFTCWFRCMQQDVHRQTLFKC
jgi:hypothetical protein